MGRLVFMVIFKESVVVKKSKNICEINYGTIQFSIEDINNKYFELLQKRRWHREELDEELFLFLSENELIIDEYENDYVDTRLEKNISFLENYIKYESNLNPCNLQQNLANKKIAILGCGGIGTVVLDNLLRVGIKYFTIIEFDLVEVSNLNRQLFFTHEDIGMEKGRILVEKVESEYPESIVHYEQIRVERVSDLLSANHLKNIDFFINCADYPQNITNIVGSFCKTYSIPWMQGAVGIETGYWGPINYGDVETIDINLPKFTIKGSISPINMLIGSFLARDVLEFFINPNQSNLFRQKTINFKDYKIDMDEVVINNVESL